MKPEIVINHEFVEFIPEELQEGTLYISKKYGTAAHKCFCGCGQEIVTPLSPVGWQLTSDGKTVSLTPSIGSWNLPCRSHYFITNNKVLWAPRWSKEQIALGRQQEARTKERHFARTYKERSFVKIFWQRIKAWFSRWP